MSSILWPAKSRNATAQNKEQLNIRLRQRVMTAAALLIIFLAFLLAVQFSTPALVGTDGYYHVKMGWLIRQQGLTPEFIWLPQTILNPAAYYDHHLLYHVYLALFASGDPAVQGGMPLITGGKIASALMPALAFLAIWWLLEKRSVPYAWLWAIGLLAISEAFLYRMNMPRAQSASLLVLVIALHFLFENKGWPMLVIGIGYVWLYNAFPLLLILIGAYMTAVLLLEKRLVWRPMVWATAGIVLGLLINPYFPENLTFIYNHLLPKIGESAVKVGNEWRPYETWTLVENSGPALAVALLGFLALGWSGQKIDRFTLTAFFLTAGFGLMLFQSRRFIEYFPPFALIFAALAVAPVLAGWRKQLEPHRWVLPLLLVGLLAYPLVDTFNRARDSIGGAQPADKYAAASRWLADHSDPGVRVFQTDWDDFTRLFFHNTEAVYTLGLDPTYMQLYDEALYDLWVDLTRGRIDEPSRVIADQFGGQFVFTDHKHEAFLEQAAADPGLEEVYRDEYAVIFEVNSP